MSSSLMAADLAALRAPFPRERLHVKVQSVSRDKTRAMLVLYLQHTDVQDRLDQVDPAWTCEVIFEERVGDMVYVRTRMTVKGVWRENVGEGQDPKSAYSDALKRCAMLFGIGRYLYDSETVWVAYDESKDRFREWTIDDYSRVAAPVAEPAPKAPAAPKPAPRPRAAPKAAAPKVLVKPGSPAAQPTPQTGAPLCCGEPMQVSRYNPNQIYCGVCKFKRPRPPAALVPVERGGH